MTCLTAAEMAQFEAETRDALPPRGRRRTDHLACGDCRDRLGEGGVRRECQMVTPRRAGEQEICCVCLRRGSEEILHGEIAKPLYTVSPDKGLPCLGDPARNGAAAAIRKAAAQASVPRPRAGPTAPKPQRPSTSPRPTAVLVARIATDDNDPRGRALERQLRTLEVAARARGFRVITRLRLVGPGARPDAPHLRCITDVLRTTQADAVMLVSEDRIARCPQISRHVVARWQAIGTWGLVRGHPSVGIGTRHRRWLR